MPRSSLKIVVFYSPKIINGVYFSDIDKPQNTYIYSIGITSHPSGMLHQLTRCREITRLYYYGCPQNNDAKYIDLEDARNQLTNTFYIIRQ